MLFVLKKSQMQRMISITRDDRTQRKQREPEAPYYRLEASGSTVTLSGRAVEAGMPATVYEPGVLFLKVTVFRRCWERSLGEKQITIQVNQDGMHIGNVRIPLESRGWLLYADSERAPKRHPEEAQKEIETKTAELGRARKDVARLERALADLHKSAGASRCG